MHLTYAELFAGAGGLSMGLEMAGWKAVAHSEIDKHARAILRKHWPDCRLDGDVSQLDGAEYAGVTLLSGGSPCQDLSIAGKRKGLEGERSGLFHQQVRIWRESGAPYILWENVLGALSSNKGEDFGVVLSTIVGGAVPVPADGWGGAGVASGPAGVAAWRVLDAQYFGVPQRRRRVFVLGVADGSVDPAEVLSLSEGLSGHPAARRQAREGVAADSGTGVGGACIPILEATPRQGLSAEGSIGIGKPFDPMFTLQSSQQHGVLTYDTTRVAHPIQNPELDKEQNGLGIRDANAPMYTLEQRGHGVVTYDTAKAVNTLQANQTQAVVLRNREGKPGGGKGPLLSAERETTLGTSNDQVVFTAGGHGEFVQRDAVSSLRANGGDIGGGSEAVVFTRQRTDEYAEKGVASTIAQRDYKSVTDIIAGIGIPRRLTPVECERLMGWPDDHTALGVDEQGREYALADTARYKACGNGVASPVAAWIAFRLRDALDTPRERA